MTVKITTLRTAAQQALEALETCDAAHISDGGRQWYDDKAVEEAITALRAALVEEALQRFTDVNQEIEAALAEPVQEPAGWFEGPFGEFRANQLFNHSWPAQTVAWRIPLYLAPPQPQRKPLAEVDLRALYDRHAAYQEEGPEASGWWNFARAIERAHGIK